MSKRAVLFLMLFIGGLNFLLAQTKVGGVVKSTSGETVPFANVIFENSSEGITTDEGGEFYLQSERSYEAIVVSFLGYKTLRVPLESSVNLNMEIILEEEAASLDEVVIYRGKTSKKDNPAIDILRKVWANRRKNGVNAFPQYSYKEYEKLQFDLNSLDSSVIKNPVFNGMEFIFDYADTNRVTGKTYLPVFINESVSRVYGDNETGRKKEVLLGNKNSGFNENRNLIDAVKDIYDDYDIYKTYIKFFDKSFVNPVSTTGIESYNYILSDSAFVDNKWCYNIIYYPRRENELTFRGNFWVNDTTWAVKKINLETSRDANINWVKQVYIEQDYEVMNDSIFLITRDFFMADFGLNKKKDSKGIYAKRTLLYDDYEFNIKKPESFYQQEVYNPQSYVYDRTDEFWEVNRLESLNKDEKGIYVMLDTLTKTRAFKRAYNVATLLESGYVDFDGWDFGPVYSTFGFNEVEGVRVRMGARTYFGQNDPWRIEGYGAYGFNDDKFKYGISAKLMLDYKSRLIITGGNRRDVEQLGASLTNTTDVLGRSLASSALLNVGDNDKLSSINLSTFSVSVDPVKNLSLRFGINYREINPASEGFSLDYYTNEERTEVDSEINQTELSTVVTFTPGRKLSGFGVEPDVVNEEDFPTFFLNYSLGVKEVFNSDFNYKKLQFFYNQPLLIGGFGRSNLSMEAGKTFDPVPLALLSVVPGNQTYFAIYNTFPTLDFYEFVTDSYVSAHFDHNFNGRFLSRIPLLRELNLRELVGVSVVWGDLSEESKMLDASGLPLQAPDDDPYYEYSFGIGNIFKVLQIEAYFRGNYFENPDARSFAIIADFGFHF
ncbi:carboxypeptidase-like regulatory domain-containing protein [Gramella sp. BOM4]|nr:carboxypeptidase-like regulatory domain-containing protein [Christiangramia bathymodioli]